MSDVRIYLFGMPKIEYREQVIKIERRKALALVAFLALHDQPQSRDVAAELLWTDQDEDHARSSLRTTLRALTTPILVEWIQADRSLLALKPDVVWVDVTAFTALLAQSRAHDHEPDTVCEQCAELFKQAAALYRGDFLAGFHIDTSAEYDAWQFTQQEWLRREYAGVLRQLSTYYADTQQTDQAIRYAQQWLAVDSLHEPAHRQLIRLYAAAGQRSEAVRQYKSCVELLHTELATPPEPETTRLYEAVMNNHRLPDGTESIASPHLGMMPPLPPLVIGRETALEEIKRRVGVNGSEMRPLTVIQGWPGVGKSTTVATLAHDGEIARQFPDGILWTSMGANPDINREIRTWADALKIVDSGRIRKIEDFSAQITTVLREKQMLLIVDDIWKAEHAAAFRVGGHACAMIVTTRFNDVAGVIAPTAADIYRLPILAESAALALLNKLTPETVAEHPEDALVLVQRLEGLPLAIHVAGRLLQNEARLGWGVRDLIAELHLGAALLMAQPPGDMIGDTSPSVAALLKRSTDALDPETRIRFALLSLFVPKPATFDLAALKTVWDVLDPRPIARKLVDRGLLEPVGGGRFQMHALLMLHAKSLLTA